MTTKTEEPICVCGHGKATHNTEAVGQIAGPATACDVCEDCPKFRPERDSVAQSNMLAGMICDIFHAMRVEEKIGHAACIIVLASGVALGRLDRERIIAALDKFIAAAGELEAAKGDKDGKG